MHGKPFVTYEQLSTWIKVWEQLLDEPRDLLLRRSFGTVVESAHNEIVSAKQRGLRRTDRMKDRLSLLRQHFDDGDPAIDLWRLGHRQEIQQLELLLRQNPFPYEPIDAILEQMRDTPSIDILKQELAAELRQERAQDGDRLDIIVMLLLRRLLTTHTAARLKETPTRAFGTTYMDLLLAKRVDLLAEDSQLNRRVLRAWFHHLVAASTSERVLPLIKVEAESLFDLYDLIHWRPYLYQVLEEIPQVWVGSVRPQRRLRNTLVDAATADHKLLAFGKIVLRRYLTALIRQALVIVADRAVTEEVDEANILRYHLDLFLENEIGLQDSHAWFRERGLEVGSSVEKLDRAVLPSIVHPSALMLATHAAPYLWHEDWNGIALKLGRCLADSLLAHSADSQFDWPELKGEDMRRQSRAWAARRTLHEDLAVVLRPINHDFPQRLSVIRDRLALLDGKIHRHRRDFWNQWTSSISAWENAFGAAFERLPWTNMTAEEYEETFDVFFAKLAQPSEEWLVTFEVEGIDPQGTRWNSGNVTFYDPNVYAYIEVRPFGQGKIEKDTTYATVTVRGETEQHAMQLARRTLNRTLATQSFALSVSRTVDGFRPEVGHVVYYYRPFGRQWGQTGGKRSSQLHSVQRAMDGRLTQFATTYDHLLKGEAFDSLNELQHAFVRALDWYMKGRWASDSTEQLLFYWIGLESVFHQGKLREELGQLHITWQDLQELIWLSFAWQEAIKQISGDEELRGVVVSDRRLRGWSSDYRVLMNPVNVRLVESLGPVTHAETKLYLRKYAADLERLSGNVVAISVQVADLRQDFEFRLRLLEARRHALVHQALAYRPDMQIYADELGDIFEDVLKKMAVEAVKNEPECTTLEDLIVLRTRQPWQ